MSTEFFFCFFGLFFNFFSNTPIAVSFRKMDPDLDAVIISAKLTRGVEVQGHFLRVVDVAACVARTWHELGAVERSTVPSYGN